MSKAFSIALRILVSAGLLALAFHWAPLWDRARLASGEVLSGTAAIDGEAVRFTTRDGRILELASGQLAGGIEQGIQSGILPLVPRIRWKETPAPFLSLGGIMAIGAWRWKRLLAAVGYRIPFRQAFELTFIGFFLGIFLIGQASGDVLKAIFVSRGQADRARPALTVFVDRLVGIAGMVLLSCAAVITHLGDPRFRLPALFLLGVAAASASLACLFLSRRIRRWLAWDRIRPRLPFAGFLQDLDQGLLAFRESPGALALATALSFAIHVILIWIHWRFARALGIGVGFLDLCVLIPVAQVIRVVPGVLGGLGVLEVSFQILLAAVAVGPAQAMALSLMVNFSNFLWSLLGGIFLLVERHRVDLRMTRHQPANTNPS